MTITDTTEASQKQAGVGRVARVTGPVVDIEFPHDSIPGIYNLGGDLALFARLDPCRGRLADLLQRLGPGQARAPGAGVELGRDLAQGVRLTPQPLDILVREGRELRQRRGKAQRRDQAQQAHQGV